MIIHLQHGVLRPTRHGSVIEFPDGSISSNWPPRDSGQFSSIANELWFAPNEVGVRAYCRDHELAHAYLSEKMFGLPSPTQWHAAHGWPIGHWSLFEERLCYHWQRFCQRGGFCEPEWGEWFMQIRERRTAFLYAEI